MARPAALVRAFREEDREAELRTYRRLDPLRTIAVEEARHWDAICSQPPYVLRKWVVETDADAAPVGFAFLRSDPESFDPGTFWVDVTVDPDHQGRGIGRLLSAAVLRDAEARGARRLWSGARSDQPRSVRFLLDHGFAERRRTWRSTLDVAKAVELPDRSGELALKGIVVTTLAEEGATREAVRRAAHAVFARSSEDEPRVGPYTPLSFEQFAQVELDGPSALPDACFLAKAEGRYVGVSALRRELTSPEALLQSYTGTLREFRGRGVATELKRRTVAYARTHGFREIRTGNDSLNAPMLAINRRLGFQLASERILGERRLGPSEKVPSGDGPAGPLPDGT